MNLFFKKNAIIYSTLLVFLFLSFAFNLFHIVPQDQFENYDHFSESLVVGKLTRAKHEGIFTRSGFAGVSYDRNTFIKAGRPTGFPDNSDTVRTSRDKLLNTLLEDRDKNIYNHYFNETYLPDSYCAYLSQIGGQTYTYSIIDKISPFSHRSNFYIFKWVNALLMALVLICILAWIDRIFGRIPFLVSFLFVFLSPWIVLFAGAAGSLWWCIWSFFLPFMVTLLLLEKRHNGEAISEKKIYMWLFIAVFLKCFFSGFEFITVPLIAIYCPIIFYAYLEKVSLKSFLLFSAKIGVVALVAVLCYAVILLGQLSFYFGNIGDALDYFIGSYKKRADIEGALPVQTISIITKWYFRDNIFNWGFINMSLQPIHFSTFWILVSSMALPLVVMYRKIERKYMALMVTTVFSFLCPFSWFYLFKDHSYWHPHFNFIIWYIPTMIFGFAVVGVAISLGCKYINSRWIDITKTPTQK